MYGVPGEVAQAVFIQHLISLAIASSICVHRARVYLNCSEQDARESLASPSSDNYRNKTSKQSFFRGSYSFT